MDPDKRKILSIYVNINKTLYDAQKSNKHCINMMKDEMQYDGLQILEDISVNSLNDSLDVLRDEIYKMLQFSHEYLDVLKDIEAVNLYDAAEIIVEIGNIRRFGSVRHFISYAGLTLVKYYSKMKSNSNEIVVANKKQKPVDYYENLKIVLTRCAKKMIYQSNEYADYYDICIGSFRQSHPNYPQGRIEVMALKKVTIRFATFIYNEFNKIADFEEMEK